MSKPTRIYVEGVGECGAVAKELEEHIFVLLDAIEERKDVGVVNAGDAQPTETERILVKAFRAGIEIIPACESNVGDAIKIGGALMRVDYTKTIKIGGEGVSDETD